MMAFVLAIRVYQETSSNAAVSFTFLSLGLPALLLGMPSGVLADYVDRKTILLFANFSRAILLLLFFFVFRHVFIIYVLVFVISSITQLFIPAEGSLMADLVESKVLLRVNSLFTLSFYSSLALGFIASGPALSLFGKHYIFLFLSFLLFIATYFIFRLSVKKSLKTVQFWINFLGKFQKLLNSTVSGLRLVVTHEKIFAVILLITLMQVIATVFSALIPGFADTILKIKVEDASFIVLGPTVLGILSGAVFVNYWDRANLQGRRFVACALFLIAGILFILPFCSFVLTLFLLYILGVLQSMLLVSSYEIVQKNVSTEFRGRAYGVLTSFIGGASIFPALIFGALADAFGISITLQILALTIVFFALYRLKTKNGVIY